MVKKGIFIIYTLLLCLVLWKGFSIFRTTNYVDLGWEVAKGNNVAIGPISGIEVRQTIFLDEELLKEPFALGCKLATYVRINTGQLEIRLVQNQTSQLFILESSKLGNNRWVYFKIDSDKFKAGPADFIITGTGATRKTAPTAWAFKGEKVTTPILLNGIEQAYQLKIKAAKTLTQGSIISGITGGFFVPILLMILMITPAVIIGWQLRPTQNKN